MDDGINIQEVLSRSELKQFIYLPEKLHKNHVNWVPPLYKDEWDYFDPKKTGLFHIVIHWF